jgi:hypothetical protein
LLNLRMGVWEGALLAVLFLAQFLTPHSIVPRNAFSVMYFVAAAIMLVRQGFELRPFARARAPDEAPEAPA